MTAVPGELTIAGNRLVAQPAAFTGAYLDLGALLGGKNEGKTAYLLTIVEAAEAMEIDLGAGSDWWMKWWVNGEVVCDTLAIGNGNSPLSPADHRFTARLKAGKNLVAVKVVSGSGGFALVLALGRRFPESDLAGLTAAPAELGLGGSRLKARLAALDAEGRLDLGALLDCKGVGQTAFLMSSLEADTSREVEFGAGADFFMKWWVNGEVVCDTLASGNGNRPPTALDHRFTARLKAGKNLVAVKVVSSAEGFALAACGSRELAEEDARRKAEAAKVAREQEVMKPRLAQERERRPSVLVTERVADLPVITGKEERYKDTVPDTLDLAERAALAVNSLTGCLDPNRGYEAAHCVSMHARPAHLSYRGGWGCHSKVVQVLPEMRLMSGSRLRAEYDRKALDWAVSHVEGDGLNWLRVDRNPHNKDMYKVDCTHPTPHGRLMIALLERYLLDGDNRWLDLTGRMADGISAAVRWNEDRAWIHEYMTRGGTWGAGGPGYNVAAGPKQLTEPDSPNVYAVGNYLRGVSQWHALSGDKRARQTADGLARHLMKVFDGRFPDAEDWSSMVAGREHGWWVGHFHSWTMGMIGLAEYAVATGNQDAARCVRGFYEYARLHGIARIGFFNAVISDLAAMKRQAESCAGAVVSPTEEQKAAAPASHGKPVGLPDEGCVIGDMTYLAVLLSEHGLGDYWEDVDQYVRNHLVEHQWTDRALMADMLAAHQEFTPSPLWHVTTDDVLDRLVGGFASCIEPTWGMGWYTQCCNGNIPQGLYKAWSAILRPQGDGVQVNLLLNRASPWLDVDSYLPYEGKAVLKIKTARSASVRMPRWADRAAVRCQVNGAARPNLWLGNYLRLLDLKPHDVATIEFPMVTTVERWTEKTYETTYTCEFRGNTLVDISPREDRPRTLKCGMDDGSVLPCATGYPIYRREHMKTDRAPMKTVERYVAPRVV